MPVPWHRLERRTDRSSLGAGNRVAAYVNGGIFYGSSDLGAILSTLRGTQLEWSPALVRYRGPTASVRDERTAFVTDEDVLCVLHTLVNDSAVPRKYSLVVEGDARQSHDFRDEARAEAKRTELLQDPRVALTEDQNVLPGALPALHLAFGASLAPTLLESFAPGTYRVVFELEVPAQGEARLTTALALDPSRAGALSNLAAALAEPDLVGRQIERWSRFFTESIPRFECADQRLVDLYYMRWYLLRFATLRGGLGAFHDSVVLEGRSAYQVYCCFSAPFMALDLRWARDPGWVEGHIAQMLRVQHEDGRFPWYATPRTAQVPVHHASATGLSFLVSTAWDAHLVQPRRPFLAQAFDGFLKNVRWWLREREDGVKGLFRIDHMLETGMDDSPRGDGEPFAKLMPLLGVDLSSYLYRDVRALASMARLLGRAEAGELDAIARRIEQGVTRELWDPKDRFFYDRSRDHAELARVKTAAGFYPFFAGLAGEQHKDLFLHLLSEHEFLTPYPVASVAKDEACFDPRSYWKGPSWPATSCHVMQAFCQTAKRFAPEWRGKARDLLDRCMAVLFTPEVDFYERYDPLDGKPLSTFKDYLHSWWIDLIMQHVIGLTPRADDVLELDPLPPRESWFRVRGVRYHGHDLTISWRAAEAKDAPADLGLGYRLEVDGMLVHSGRAERTLLDGKLGR